ncbi:MAG: GLUG motif-containing protein, partial [Candidatus Scatosoma sp.]
MKRKPKSILLLFLFATLCAAGCMFAACSSAAVRSAEEYTLSVADTAGGDIIVYVNGKESNTAREGDGVRVALKAETGYTYVEDSFTVNSLAKAFSFSMPKENLVLSAEFEKIMYTVSGVSYEYGTITPSVTQAAYGDEFTVTVTPKNSVCAVMRRTLRMNGTVLDRSTRYEPKEYTVTMPNCNVEFSAEFISLISFAGDGTEQSPWLIGTAEEFVEFASAVTEYGFASAGTYFKLTDDITVTDESFTGVGKASGDEFKPESAVSVAFGGVFDGDGHTITVNLAGSTYTGLFRANTGTVKNLTVAGSVTGGSKNAGGVVAYNYGGRIENCVNKAVVSSTAASSYHFGGIAGFSYGGVISGCTNLAFVDVSGHTFGGIAGYAGYGATIENCTNGSAEDTLQGAVYGAYELGGIVGYLGVTATLDGQITGSVINNCTNYAAIGGTSYAVGGIVGTMVS